MLSSKEKLFPVYNSIDFSIISILSKKYSKNDTFLLFSDFRIFIHLYINLFVMLMMVINIKTDLINSYKYERVYNK